MNLQRPACHAAWHEFSAAECMHSCYQRAVHITRRENRAGVIFCSQEVNAFEANPAFVRLRLARPAATVELLLGFRDYSARDCAISTIGVASAQAGNKVSRNRVNQP